MNKNQKYLNHHQYFMDSVSFRIISDLKSIDWYNDYDFQIRLDYYVYENCHYVFTGHEVRGNINDLDINAFVNSLNNNLAYKNYLENLINLHCEGIKESGITNGLNLKVRKLSKNQIKCLRTITEKEGSMP